MSYTERTEYYCKVNTEKEYTSFRWDLPDFNLLQEYYMNVWATEFTITNTDAKCNLEFVLKENPPNPKTCPIPAPAVFQSPFHTANSTPIEGQSEENTCLYVHFPRDKPFDKMKVIVSILDACGGKVLSKNKIRGINDDKMIFRLFPTSTLLTPILGTTYLHNDTLTILCEIINIKNQQSSLIDTKTNVENYNSDVQKKLQIYFENDTFCDVVFVVGDAEFHGHKIIIAANSSVFEAMFKTDMTEKNDKRVTISDTDDKTFEAFLKYLYTGSVSKLEDLVDDLLILADKYHVTGLRNMCETHIADNLSRENAIQYLLMGYMHNFVTLKGKAMAFVRSCQQEIVDSAEFKKLCNYPDLVSEIFRKPI